MLDNCLPDIDLSNNSRAATCGRIAYGLYSDANRITSWRATDHDDPMLAALDAFPYQ